MITVTCVIVLMDVEGGTLLVTVSVTVLGDCGDVQAPLASLEQPLAVKVIFTHLVWPKFGFVYKLYSVSVAGQA